MNDNHIADERELFLAWLYKDRPVNSEPQKASECMFEAWQARALLAAPIAPRAKYDPATQPGDPAYDGAEAYQAHLEAMYPDAPDERADADIRRAALEEAYDAAMSCDGALNNAGAVALKIRALIAAATPASSAGLFGWVSKRDFDLHSGFVGRKVLDDDVPLYAAPASSVADAAEAYGKGYSAGKAFEQRHAAGASERADAEKDAAMTDEELQQIAFKHCYATTASDGFIFLKDADRGLREFARAILAANGEKK